MGNNTIPPLSVADAARLLAVSPRTVTRLIDRGDLGAIRIGSTLAVPLEGFPAELRACFGGGRPKALLTLHDVAARLGCAPGDVRMRSSSGEFSPVRVGRSLRWLPADIERSAHGEARS